MERKKLVVEGAGAAPLAALYEHSERVRGKKLVLILSGGNIDFTIIDRIIHKSLLSSGRIGILKIIVDDVPGRLHQLTGIVARHGGNILNVAHDRLVQDIPVGKTLVVLTLEARGFDHVREMTNAIGESGFDFYREG